MTLVFIYKMILGLFFSSLAASFGYFAKLFHFSGVIVSIVTGTLIIACGPWYGIVLLGLFFCSSGFIHLMKLHFKNPLTDSISEKGAQRDGVQVLANSLPAVLSLIAFFITQQTIFLVGFTSGISGATADTWASEIGVLSKSKPRNILTRKTMVKGQSGGISLLGSLASIFGALLISCSFYLFLLMDNQFQTVAFYFVTIPFLAGYLNSILDSILGSAIQASYRCRVCGKQTEKSYHHDKPAQLVKGYVFITNDTVNFLSGCLTVLIGFGLYLLQN